LRRLEWRIVPKPETLVDYYKGLVERGEGYVMEKEEEEEASMSNSAGAHQGSNTGSVGVSAAEGSASITASAEQTRTSSSRAVDDKIDEMSGVIEEAGQNS
jgi:hypothetical protein